MLQLWNTIFYEPLYNALVFLIGNMPGGDIALAVIVLTVVVKLILSPLSYKAIINQIVQKKLKPLVDEIKEKYPDKQEQSQKTLELFREHKSNPFAGCLLIILQIPVIIALYTVFLRGVDFNVDLLYGTLSLPETFNVMFLGLLDLSAKSIPLALLAALTQFIQMKYSPTLAEDPEDKDSEKPTDPKQESATAFAMKNMQKQMKYTMPVMIGVFAYIVPGAVALYWVVNNIFTFIQELVIRKRVRDIRAMDIGKVHIEATLEK